MPKSVALAVALAASITVPSALAQTPSAGNFEKLSGFKVTGASPDVPTIPQTGPKADAIRKILSKIKLPEGFKISLYAIVPDARHMAVGPQGVVMFVGTRKSKVYAVTDRDKDRVADEVKVFAASLPMVIPNGPCFSKDGFLYIAEQNRVLVYPAAEFFYESPDVAVANVVKQGELIPKEEESFNHTARVCRIGPDDKLYISLGQPFNVPAKEKMDLYTRPASAASSAWTATARTARSLQRACATRWAWISTRRTAASGSPTIRWTAWATTSRRAS